MTLDLRYRAASLLRELLSVMPACCSLCQRAQDAAVCLQCHADHVACRKPRCSQCALPLPPGQQAPGRCGACLAKPPHFDATLAVTDYIPPVDQLVQALKFHGRLALAPYFGKMIAERALEAFPECLPDSLVPVPLGRQRLAERGFNQSLEIARSTAALLRVPLSARLLERARETRAQTLVEPDERRRNLRGAFVIAAASGGVLQGRHVGVVDDVMTTGETLNAVAAALKANGAARVTNLVFARTAVRFG